MFPKDLKFIYPWRQYQARVLKELEQHFDDNHLHIVAAPGSGKTILGLETLRRIGEKTLVLSPNLTIRNQWLDRFEQLFKSASNNDLSHLTSFNIDSEKHLIFSSYQALFALDKKNSDKSEPFAILKNVKTLVLDEAHHLRNEWWKSLLKLKEYLNEPKTISLTATPPFDVSPKEWNRYFTMCGPIDAEIPVPELVGTGELAPHQDLIYFSEPSKDEKKVLNDLDKSRTQLKDTLLNDPHFKKAIVGHPYFSNYDAEISKINIYQNPEILSSMIVFLNQCAYDCSKQLAFLGIDGEKIPELDFTWLQILLQDYLFDEHEKYFSDNDHRLALKKRLKSQHLLDKKKVCLNNSAFSQKILSNSKEKLNSIKEIITLENDNKQDNLRMVILTNFIRPEYMSAPSNDMKMGTYPIFETLREHNFSKKMAMLTGSFVIVSRDIKNILIKELNQKSKNIQNNVFFVPLLSDSHFLLLKINDKIKNHIVTCCTSLFNKGHIQIIIGTSALLGEGWDSVTANTLILANSISTYVQTNQMRGRVIRIDPNQKKKCSNIWHLCSIDPNSYDGGQDILTLKKRFKVFEGLDASGKKIESGFERLAFNYDFKNKLNNNAFFIDLAKKRNQIFEKWKEATKNVYDISSNHFVKELRVEGNPLQRVFKANSIRIRKNHILGLPFSGGLLLCTLSISSLANPMAIILTSLFFLHETSKIKRLIKTLKNIKTQFKWKHKHFAMACIGDVILKALCETKIFKTKEMDIELVSENIGDDQVSCYLKNTTFYENELFVTCLEETINPISNPKYILITGDKNKKKQYYPVPSPLSKKEKANVFLKHWVDTLGPAQLEYTRNQNGKDTLAIARTKTWSFEKIKQTKRISSWK